MAARREPIFLARATYRRRRLIDAMRFLPVVGLLVFLAPLLGGAAGGRSTAQVGAFIFFGWFGLIVVAAILVRILSRAPGGVGSDPTEPDPTGGDPGATGGGG